MAKEMMELELTKLIKQLDLDNLHEELDVEPLNIDTKSSVSTYGTIQVKNQSIIVKDPEGDGKQPIIRGVSPVRLIVNDNNVVDSMAVTSTDRIRWKIAEEPMFKIYVSKDKMQAFFHLKAKERYAWQLIDAEPAHEMLITAEQNKSLVIETIQLNDVIAQIEKMYITANLDVGAIYLELEKPTYQPVLIARGKEIVPAKDAELELYFSEQVESQFTDITGRVDFRNHLQIPTVKVNDLIAKKIPLVEGIPGYDVFGNYIQPDPPKDIIVITKPSVVLTPNGEIRALKSGRPRITGHRVKSFDISTAFVVSGDVNFETGNIVFSGDVVVYGNVMDYMIIESLGNVYVYGNVYNATITATGSVYVKGNVIGSKLYCGYFGVMFNRLYQASKTLGEQVRNLMAATEVLIRLLESKKQKVRYGHIIMLLIENKFNEIPSIVRELLVVLTNIQHIKKKEYQKLAEICEIFLNPPQVFEMATVNLIQSFLSLLQETHLEVASMQEEKTEVKLGQSNNSEIKSNGDIIILKDGVVLSDLYATRDIKFIDESAVCRGSKLESGGSIIAKVVGGQTGVNTLLLAKTQVTIQKMFIGRICVGKHCFDIDDVIENKTFNSYDFVNQAM